MSTPQDFQEPISPELLEAIQALPWSTKAEWREPDVDARWRQLQLRSADAGRTKGGYQQKNWGRSLGGAGVLMVVALVLAWQVLKPSNITESYKTYATKPGERATIILQSGAQVTLGPATTLSVYNNKANLAGEAVFTVLHKDDAPFTVHAGNTTARVLGTTFAIRKYAEDQSVRVAVADGKVGVNSAVLSAGDIAMASSNNQVSVSHDAEAMLNAFAFSQGKLIIDVQTLAEAAPELSRWLNLDIRVDSSAAGQRLTTTLHHHTVTQALDQIAVLTETRYQRHGRVVIFTRN